MIINQTLAALKAGEPVQVRHHLKPRDFGYEVPVNYLGVGDRPHVRSHGLCSNTEYAINNHLYSL